MDSTKVFILFLMRIYTDFLFMGLNKDGDPKVPIYLIGSGITPYNPITKLSFLNLLQLVR
jgi:hypothetical protein